MIKTKQIRVRDPYIVLADGVYYMYVSRCESDLVYYKSEDLKNWEFGGNVFAFPENFWAYTGRDVWAPEVHKYNGKFYMFVSLMGKNGLRGTQIAVSEKPEGPFVPVANHPATPIDDGCIDGTLYVQDGTPYIVYSHDWPDNLNEETNEYMGEIAAVQLSDDLTENVGEPWVLFTSRESPISKATPHVIREFLRYGSDAPFLHKMSNGSIFLTWSPYLNDNYVVLGAVSESGDIRGPWKHLETSVYDKNGGHAMLFEDKEGKLCMAIHGPEIPMLERLHVFEMTEKDGKLEILNKVDV